jgi:tetratricopeptide (TPR) repeat protein
MNQYEAMPNMMTPLMRYLFPYLRNKFPAFYYLEIRDWRSAAALKPADGGGPEAKLVTYWARVVANGHLQDPTAARGDFEHHESLMEEVKHGEYAYIAQSTFAQISRNELLGWVAFADGRQDDALKHMREAADLQDKVGQAEVDMLGDMLLELHHPHDALVEYHRALKLSPNRFNGLFGAGRAAEAGGDQEKAVDSYSVLLKSTNQGSHSTRPEIAHARTFLSSGHVSSN